MSQISSLGKINIDYFTGCPQDNDNFEKDLLQSGLGFFFEANCRVTGDSKSCSIVYDIKRMTKG